MKKRSNATNSDEILPEYDLSGVKGVRGKYHQAYQQGHEVRVNRGNGTVDVRYFTLEDGAVMLEPDVREHFPDSRAVNRALRKLIPTSGPRRRANSSR